MFYLLFNVVSEEDLFLIGSVISTWPHHHVCQLVGLSSNLSVVRSVLENLDFLLLSEHLLVIEVKLFDFAMVIYIGNKKAAIFWDLKSVRIYFANSACYLHNFCSLFEISAKFAYTLLLYTFFCHSVQTPQTLHTLCTIFGKIIKNR